MSGKRKWREPDDPFWHGTLSPKEQLDLFDHITETRPNIGSFTCPWVDESGIFTMAHIEEGIDLNEFFND